MISNVTSSTSSTAADTTSSAASSSPSNITEVNGLFGEMFIQNLGSSDPTMVGWDFGPNNIQLPPGMTLADLDSANTTASTSTSTSSSTSASTASTASTTSPAASTDAVTSDLDTSYPVVTTVPTSTSSTSSTSAATSSTSSSGDLIPGISDTNPNDVLSAQEVFGSTPWVSSAGGTGPSGNFNLNPEYFATQQTAQTVAQMVGGAVVPVNNMAETPGDVFTQNTDNEMVQLPDGGMINAGLVAGFFTHGYSLSMVQSMVQNEVSNVESATQATQGGAVTA